MKIEFVRSTNREANTWHVQVDGEYVGSIVSAAFHSKIFFIPGFKLESNFPQTQLSEIMKAVNEKIAHLNLVARMLA